MADSRPRTRVGVRRGSSGRQTIKTVSDSRKEKAGRTTLLKQRPTVLPDLDDDTPRVMLKRIIQTQPQVSPLAPRISRREEAEAARSELPSRGVSSMGEMQLPDLVPEDMSIASFRMTGKRKKLSISEFERAADKRLPQNEAQSTLNSTALARSLHMSLGSLIPPDTVEKRGLLRRPKNRKAIDMEAFEGGVEQNMLKRKAQDYLVDSQTASVIQTAMLTSDAEIMLSNTELFVQPQFNERSQNKLSALEPQLSNSKTSAQRSKISDAAQEEARLGGLVSSVRKNEGRTRRYSEDLILDRKHVDRMSPVSPKTPAKQQEDKQEHSQRSNPMEQLSLSEEVVVGAVNRWSSSLPSRSSSKCLGSPVTPKPKRSFTESLREFVSHIIEDLDASDTEEEMANTVNRVEQEEILGEAAEHRANSGYSEHLEKKLIKKAESQITTAQDARVEEEMAPSEEEGVAEGSVEHQGSPKAEREIAKGVEAGSLGRHSHAFSSSEKSAMKPLDEAVEQADELENQAITVELDGPEELTEDEAESPENEEVSMKTPGFVRAAAYKPLLSTPRPAKPAVPKSPLQPLRAKPVPKRSGASRKKTREPGVASSLIKKIFRHYVKMPVARDAFKIVEKCSVRYFKQLSSDLEAYTRHAGRKTVEMADLEVLMRRQGLVTDKMPLCVLIERYLPLEYRKLLIPIAVSGNKVIPCK
ncbi:centromere protein T isoform X2 [Rissa tridactyla]|uniref:centromere protein T isoform X2 n=1 Tax=Rissa tridactyla TaxID=75485 RepID=UPI0023BAE6DD|nr:centromere protein T isoform X2 [Rissa tridactyla]